MKVYSGLKDLPSGHSDPDTIIPGCLVLEGGAFRGLYTEGALDAMLLQNINIQTTIGISAGAMSGVNYVSEQVGRSARLNLKYRHHRNYVGAGAIHRDHGITGFSFAFGEFAKEDPFDEKAFYDPRHRFLVCATDVETGQGVYLEKGICTDILKGVQASASVPYVSAPVEVDGGFYLDGGISVHIPIDWALQNHFEKIFVIRTRDRAFRKEGNPPKKLIRMQYHKYPALMDALINTDKTYNELLDRIDEMEREGRILVLAPSKPVNISRFEGNMEKLGELYWEGFREASEMMPAIKKYFGISE